MKLSSVEAYFNANASTTIPAAVMTPPKHTIENASGNSLALTVFFL